MKKSINVLQAELNAKAREAAELFQATAAKCDAEDNRLMTPEERGAIQAIADQGSALKAELAARQGDTDMLAEINRLTSGLAPLPPRVGRIRSYGEQFVTAAEFEFFRKGGHRASSAWRSPSFELFSPSLQAATLTEDPASGGALVQPHFIGLQQPVQRPLLVADLFAQGTTGSNLISFMREKVWTNAAAPVAEGALKPESTLTFEAGTSPVRKLAHWLPVTEELLEDAPGIRSYIDARLINGVQVKEDDQLLNGTGVAPELLGIRLTPGLQPALPLGAGMANADGLLAQALAIFAASHLMPDGFVLNPADWATTLLTKNEAGDYYTGGPFSPIVGASLWGLPVAVTPSQPAGTGLTGAFKTGAQLFRHGGIRVEASNSHADFFVKNLVAIRAEERLALAVYRPGAFGEVTGLSPVGGGAREGREPNAKEGRGR